MRISKNEGINLIKHSDLLELGQQANEIKQKKFGNTTTFIIDRNINYTNICQNECDFCAFFRRKNQKSAYLLSHEEILEKVREAIELDAT